MTFAWPPRPARLCTITPKYGDPILFTDAQVPVVIGPSTWLPGLAELSAVKNTIGGETASCQITAALGDVFDSTEIRYGQFDGATVALYTLLDRIVPGTLYLELIAQIGDVTFAPSGGYVNFDILGDSPKGDRKFTQKFGAMCRVDLFSPLCGLDEDDWTQTAVVTEIVDNFNILIGSLSSPARADGFFTMGRLTLTSGDRTNFAVEIITYIASSGVITLPLPAGPLFEVGDTIELLPGCFKRRLLDCHTKFDNAVNFQGEDNFAGARAVAAQV